ncbi:MAG TPA: serine hydrolase domain-containing protein, partial [Gemmatimonadaceae bacterium]|nr:serine hydrolase domain-containing protein [Gemmatimonadaceae bacterium]
KRAMREDTIAGMSVHIARGSKTIFSRAFGLADAEGGVAATPHTVYRIGSITKQFTAAAVMQLVEQGKLSLDDDFTKYVPEFPARGRRVTIRQLLDHTSGIRSFNLLGDAWLARSHDERSQREMIDLIASAPYDFEPGTWWVYSNSGYYLLGVVIERVSGQSYADYLRDHVFARAGLTATTYCDERAIIPNRARGYQLIEGRMVNTLPLSMSQLFAAGAICSTAPDLARWAQALHDGRVVSRQSYEMMATGATLADGTRRSYGFAMNVASLLGHRKLEHSGWATGAVSVLVHYPDDSLTIAILTNTQPLAVEKIEETMATAILRTSDSGKEKAPAPVPEVPLTAEAAARFVGDYALGPVRVSVTAKEGRLVARARGYPLPWTLAWRGGETFGAVSDPTLRVVFHVSGAAGEARADSVTVFQREGSIRGIRVR